jgi:chorismate mutase
MSGRREEIRRLAHELASYEERAELADEVARLRRRLAHPGAAR